MSDVPTKTRILQQALALFNTAGFGTVNLFELAKSLEMSRGNMTYHFKDKNALLKELSDLLWEELAQRRATIKNIPSFENLHHDVQLYYEMQEKYAFIFQDHQVRKHPLIAPKLKELAENAIENIKTAIAFSIQLGNLKPEPAPGIYNNLAQATWMLMFFWTPQKKLLNQGEDSEKIIWSLLYPHLTERGKHSFQKFFGQEYAAGFGQSFEENMNTYFTF